MIMRTKIKLLIYVPTEYLGSETAQVQGYIDLRQRGNQEKKKNKNLRII
jgi:hypothetical protein